MEHVYILFMKPAQVKNSERVCRIQNLRNSTSSRKDVVEVYTLQESSSDWVPVPWYMQCHVI